MWNYCAGFRLRTPRLRRRQLRPQHSSMGDLGTNRRRRNPAPLSSPAVSATAGARIIDPDHVEDHPPAMPCVAETQAHRTRMGPKWFPFNACVARPVGKAELERTPAAQEADRKEWGRLREKENTFGTRQILASGRTSCAKPKLGTNRCTWVIYLAYA